METFCPLNVTGHAEGLKSKHHLSLCKQSSTMMIATEGTVVYPVVVIKINNNTCRALQDTGAGSFYASCHFWKN